LGRRGRPGVFGKKFGIDKKGSGGGGRVLFAYSRAQEALTGGEGKPTTLHGETLGGGGGGVELRSRKAEKNSLGYVWKEVA